MIGELWIFFAFSTLIVLTYQDYKNNMVIDPRFNYFMLGCSSFIFAASPVWEQGIIKIFLLSLLVYVVADFIYRLLRMGGGDIDTLRWINVGLFAINPKLILVFNLILMIMYIIHGGIIRIGCKIKKIPVKNTPFFIVILLAFFVTFFFFL